MRALRSRAAANALPLAVAAAAFTLAVGLSPSDPDMWWHLASGRWMVEHREGIRVDVFSSTATGEPYALGEWLGQVVLYEAYAAAGWLGVALLRGGLVALAAFGVTRLALRAAPARVAIPVAAFAIVLSKPTWTDRPQLFTLALFPVILDLCFAARAGSRAALLGAVALIALWANLHGGYALGIAMLWIFAVEAVLSRRPSLGFITSAVGAMAVASLEPGALSLPRALAHVGGSVVRIVEESPADPLTPFGALFALFVGATLALLMLRGGSLLGALVLVPMLGLALSAQRHIPLFGFAAVPFLVAPLTAVVEEMGTTLKRMRAGEGLSEAFRRARVEGSPSGTAPPSSRARPLAPAVALAMWIVALASIATVDPRPDLSAYPSEAIATLESTNGILFNEYDWGGYLIWSAPSRPVFVDGRLYPFAGNGVMSAYQSAIHVLPSWRAVIERWNVSQALVRPDRALAQALRDEGWVPRAQASGFVLLERPR